MTRLLLLHGNASSRHHWRLVTERLDRPAHAPDLPGFGDAPARAVTAAQASRSHRPIDS